MSKSITKTRYLTTRVTENMYEQIVKKAEIAEVTISEYVRNIIGKELQEQDEIQNRYGYDPANRVLPKY